MRARGARRCLATLVLATLVIAPNARTVFKYVDVMPPAPFVAYVLLSLGLVLVIGLQFKRREAERRAAAEERERLLARLQQSLDELRALQTNLVTVCAWTQRVLDEGKWVRFEEFLDKRLNISVSHGISEDAAKEELQNLEDWMSQSSDATQGSASSSSALQASPKTGVVDPD